MLVLPKLICDSSWREEVAGSRIKATLPIGIEVHGRRKDQRRILGYAARHHRLNVVREVLGEIVITFNARISRQRYW